MVMQKQINNVWVVYDPRKRSWIPVGIAMHGAGPDAYLRHLIVSCQYCNTSYPCGESDCECMCQVCVEESYEENEREDGHA